MDVDLFDLLFSSDSSSSGSADLDEAIDSAVALTIGTMIEAANEEEEEEGGGREFYANGNSYNAGYYLSDGIYPEYSTFVKTFTDPIDEKRKYFKKRQESARKDIERAFGVLKKRWKVLSFPSRYWKKKKMHDIVYACIILHNMILQDEDKAYCQDYNDQDPTLEPDYWKQQTPIDQRVANNLAIRNNETYNMLLADLVDHLWDNHRPNNEEYVPPEVNDYFSDDE